MQRSPGAKPVYGVCEVCFGMRNDITPKTTWWCKICKVFMCEACEPDLESRGIVALKKLFKFGPYAKKDPPLK